MRAEGTRDALRRIRIISEYSMISVRIFYDYSLPPPLSRKKGVYLPFLASRSDPHETYVHRTTNPRVYLYLYMNNGAMYVYGGGLILLIIGIILLFNSKEEPSLF